MHNQPPTLMASKKYIDELDLTNIINKITCKHELTSAEKIWSVEKAHYAVQEYKRFLFLKRKYMLENHYLPPSTNIDEIWHHHILDTRQYHEDCQAIFGSYLHHCPYFGLRGKADFEALLAAFEVTQKLYFEEYGDYLWEYEAA